MSNEATETRPVNPFQPETIYVASWRDFENLVHNFYGREEYDFVVDQEASNDSQHRFEVTPDDLNIEWEAEEIDKYKEKGEYSYSTEIFLADLCRAGVIQPGTYLITVCW